MFPQRLEKLVLTANHHAAVHAGPSAALGADSHDGAEAEDAETRRDGSPAGARTLQPELRWTAKQMSRLGGCSFRNEALDVTIISLNQTRYAASCRLWF